MTAITADMILAKVGAESAPEQPPDSPSLEAREPALRFRSIADLCVEVDAAGPRRWLVRGIWPAGAYGVHAAEPKAGKTWNAFDLAVSVASGTPWLEQHPVDTTGPVVLFVGEGGDGNVVRRLRAIAAARGLTLEALPIHVCTRAPHLGDDHHMSELAAFLAQARPVLAVLDPLYLSAGGANGADLYAMGRLLERPQHLCERAGASLLVVTHYNRARDLRGAARITGAGPAEWGRVLISAAVISRSTDAATKATTVLTELDVQGGEVPDQTLRLRRVVRAVNPDDLDSALEYRVDEPHSIGTTAVELDLSPAAAKLLEALNTQDTPAPANTLVNAIVQKHGHGLTRQTVSRELNRLSELGIVEFIDHGNGRTRLWRRSRP